MEMWQAINAETESCNEREQRGFLSFDTGTEAGYSQSSHFISFLFREGCFHDSGSNGIAEDIDRCAETIKQPIHGENQADVFADRLAVLLKRLNAYIGSLSRASGQRVPNS